MDSQNERFASRRRGPGRRRPDLDAAVRGYLAELASRYLPFLLVIGVLLLLVLEAPTERPRAVSVGSGPGLAAGQYSGGSGPAATGSGTGAGATAVGNQPANPDASTGAPGSAAGSAGTVATGAAGAGHQTPTASGPAPAAGQYAVSGVKCGPGALQVTGSAYAPPCVPAWKGNNGGATARGVTASTITISYREEGESSDVNAVRSIMPGVIPSDAQALYDLNVFLQYFNKEYELYGRHVVVKPYPAQGDAFEELVGQDTQGAQEDAATAAGMGAFGDITPIPTPLYASALVQNHVISMNNLLASAQFLQQSAPYAYSLVPDLDVIGSVLESSGCSLGSSNVSFAGDQSLNGKPRVFGLIVPEDPQFSGMESQVVAGLKRCGVKIPVVVNYSIDLSSIQQEMQNAISQMKAGHVTTVVCGCDPVGLIYVSQAADQQNYGPEWMSEWLPDQFERTFAPDQWSHSVEFGLGPAIPQAQNEAYRVFKEVDPNGEPAEPLYMFIYYQLLYLFNGLQAAGPDLTPATMLAGLQHLPPSQPGQVGQWSYGTGVYWPLSQLQISYWDPTKVSAADDKEGDYASCSGGRWYSVSDPAGFPRTLSCPGQPS